MARGFWTVLELRAGSLAEADLRVRQATGSERLSEPFAFEIEFLRVDGEPLDLGELRGAEALLTWRRPEGTERFAHGIIWAAEMMETAAGKPRYRARLAPRLERLRHVRRSRVFQNASVPDIAKQVLDEGEVKHRLSLSESRPEREYCVQYRESDLAFVQRLLEEEGIFFYFEHGSDEHVMVLADAGSGCAELTGEPALPFRVGSSTGDGSEDEHLFRLEHSHGIRAGKVELEDFDFERPELPLTGTSRDAGDALGLEHYEYPGGFADPGAGARLAKVRLEELRFGADAFHGQGTCLRFVPGATFEVSEHPDDDFNRKLLLVGVEHEWREQEGSAKSPAVVHGYRNRFVALDAGLAYRPPRRVRPPVAWAETAMVVGPGAEEIHPDEHGRIKVQFHWDREGKKDEKSSCWIRVAQAWAGPAWGASFVPRIGQEVLVRFADGDPDRPLVMGAVFNGANPPPMPLPEDKTRSTLRTDSSPGGGGFNEVRLEDHEGYEEIFLHAQRDENVEVRNDKRQLVKHDESLEVAKDRSIAVQGRQELRVDGDDASAIRGSQTIRVAGDRTTAVAGRHAEAVGMAQSIGVAGNRHVTAGATTAESAGAAAALTVGAAYAVNVAGALNEAVGGLKSGQVGGERVEIVGAARSEIVGKDSATDVGGDVKLEVKGQVVLDAGKDHREEVGGKLEVEVVEPVAWEGKKIQLQSDELSVVVAGKEVLSVDKSGNVTFGVSNLKVEGDTIGLKGSKVAKSAAGSASSASPRVTRLEPMPGEKAFVEIALQDQDGNPLANQWFQVEFPDGTVKEGRTDGEGHAWVPGPKEGQVKVTLPKLDKGSARLA